MFLFGILGCSDTEEIVDEVCSNEVLEVDDVLEWSEENDLPRPFNNSNTFVVDGIGYIAGDVTLGDFNFAYEFWKYDPTIGLWLELDSIPISSPYIIRSSFSIDQKGYIIVKADVTLPEDQIARVYEYDTQLFEWRVVAEVPGSRLSEIKTIVLGNSLYLIKPTTINSSNKAEFIFEVWSWEPETNQWNELEDFQGEGRSGAIFFEQNDILYYGMGDRKLGVESDRINDMWKYDLSSNQWTQITDFPECPLRIAQTFEIENDNFIAHGSDGVTSRNKMYKFSAEEWIRVNTIVDEQSRGGAINTFNFEDQTHIFYSNEEISILSEHSIVKLK